MMKQLASLLARSAGGLSRLVGAGAGSSLPGKLLLRLDPQFVGRKAREMHDGCIVVSGTNGKTTTASMIQWILKENAVSTVSNASGANLAGGIATALLQGAPGAKIGLFEIDEAALPAMVQAVHPRTMVFTNVFRDQLDRFGEAESVLGYLQRAANIAGPSCKLIVNSDDPALWSAVQELNPVGFGVLPLPGRSESRSESEPETCPKCLERLSVAVRTIGHLGKASCSSCGWKSRPPDYEARVIEASGLTSVVFEVKSQVIRLGTGGLHNVYNAVAAVAAAAEFGIPVSNSAAALGRFQSRFGRWEELKVNGSTVRLVLMKNPAGAGVLIDEISTDSDVGSVVVAVSDRLADGRDISWIWDAEFERLSSTGVAMVPSGTRAHDVAVRLKYAGITPLSAQPEPLVAINTAIQACPEGRLVVIMATYTAMLETRRAIFGSRESGVLEDGS